MLSVLEFLKQSFFSPPNFLKFSLFQVKAVRLYCTHDTCLHQDDSSVLALHHLQHPYFPAARDSVGDDGAAPCTPTSPGYFCVIVVVIVPFTTLPKWGIVPPRDRRPPQRHPPLGGTSQRHHVHPPQLPLYSSHHRPARDQEHHRDPRHSQVQLRHTQRLHLVIIVRCAVYCVG